MLILFAHVEENQRSCDCLLDSSVLNCMNVSMEPKRTDFCGIYVVLVFSCQSPNGDVQLLIQELRQNISYG